MESTPHLDHGASLISDLNIRGISSEGHNYGFVKPNEDEIHLLGPE